MAAKVYTFHIGYQGLEKKIWRRVEVSSSCRLDRLGYLVLATFDTMAYHMFAISFRGQHYGLPDSFDLTEQNDLAQFTLEQLDMRVGERMQMDYDFGTTQTFVLKLEAIADMPRGKGAHYPWVLDGAGSGIVDDMHVCELRELVEQIDRNGKTDEPLYYPEDDEVPWDYRTFDLKAENMVLKTYIRRIEESYAPFWEEA